MRLEIMAFLPAYLTGRAGSARTRLPELRRDKTGDPGFGIAGVSHERLNQVEQRVGTAIEHTPLPDHLQGVNTLAGQCAGLPACQLAAQFMVMGTRAGCCGDQVSEAGQ
jgi:hypothetical protein